MTEYMILEKARDGSGTWKLSLNGTFRARSAKSAIAKHSEDRPEDQREGEFVAVPARSWKPVTVKVETKTALKFS